MELTAKSIKVKQHADSWQQAIEIVGNILEEQGSTTAEYTEKMIQAVIELGPYMVIIPGFALVHAQPGNGVKSTAMALVTLETPVNFNSVNDPVAVLLGLACIDKTSHMQSLQKIAKALMKDGMIETLRQCTTLDEIFACLQGEEME